MVSVCAVRGAVWWVRLTCLCVHVRACVAGFPFQKLRGVTNIKKMYTHDEADVEWDQERGLVDRVVVNGKSSARQVTVYDTDGTNLAEVLAVDGVDATRTVSNNVTEILGVRTSTPCVMGSCVWEGLVALLWGCVCVWCRWCDCVYECCGCAPPSCRCWALRAAAPRCSSRCAT